MARSTRYVKENAAGGWDVVKEGHRRATAHEATKTSALSRATALTKGEGGGEVFVLNKAGKIVSSKKVDRPSGGRRQPRRT